MELAGEVYQEEQPDDEGMIRKVWIFPIRLTGEERDYQPPDTLVRAAKQQHEKKARKNELKI